MREKHPFIVLSFQTTVAAMEWEKRCMEMGIPGRLIPLPREISAGCGLAWRMRPEEWEQWSGRIDTSVYDKVVCGSKKNYSKSRKHNQKNYLKKKLHKQVMEIIVTKVR